MSKKRVTACLVLLSLLAAVRAAGQQESARGPYRMSLPGSDWAFEMDLSAFHLPTGGDDRTGPRPGRNPLSFIFNPVESVSADGNEYQLAVFQQPEKKSDKSMNYLRVRLGPARAGGTAADFRDYTLKNLSKRTRLKGDAAKTSDYKGIPVARYTVKFELDAGNPLSGPIPVVNYGPRTLEAYFVKEDSWVRVTLSGRDVGEREEQLFHSLLDTAKFVDTSAPSTSYDYFHKGRVLYLSRDYGKAAEFLAYALGLEHKQRRLDAATWRTLVSNLVDSLGGAGDIKRAKETLDYAVAQDPTYPVFQLALARYYARLGDLEQTIAHLQKAFSGPEGGGLAGPLPHPSFDPAFERFRKDERFKKAVKEIKKSGF